MIEREVKILKIDVNAVVQKLEKLGAHKKYSTTLTASYYDTVDNRLEKDMSCLRLRTDGTKHILAYKKTGEQNEVKDAEEHEVQCEDMGTMKTILNCLGLQMYKQIRKKRTSYQYHNAVIDIDEFEDTRIPPLLEIECGDVDVIFRVAALLGFSKEQCKAWSGADVARHYGLDEYRRD